MAVEAVVLNDTRSFPDIDKALSFLEETPMK